MLGAAQITNVPGNPFLPILPVILSLPIFCEKYPSHLLSSCLAVMAVRFILTIPFFLNALVLKRYVDEYAGVTLRFGFSSWAIHPFPFGFCATAAVDDCLWLRIYLQHLQVSICRAGGDPAHSRQRAGCL